MFKIFAEYKGLRREFYILLLGRMVSSMGALVFSMLTLILKNKLGYSPSQVADILLLATVIYLPGTLIAGRLCDRYNKRNLIIIFSLVTISCELVCAFIPLSMITIIFHICGSLFSLMQWPCYDALFADLSKTKDRDRVYSLNYLGNNLGGILNPIVGGLLFAKHLNISFLITALSALVSTLMVFFFVKDISKEKDDEIISSYEKDDEQTTTVRQVLRNNKIIIFYFFCLMIGDMVYSQFMFLLPLNLEQIYLENGAQYFGFLMSLNSFTVVVGTPLLTNLLKQQLDIKKVIIGQVLIVTTLCCFIFVQGGLPWYFLIAFVFTLGEICSSLGQKPYLTKRVPASYRGRIISISIICVRICQALFDKGIGYLMEMYNVQLAWVLTGAIGLLVIASYFLLAARDKKHYPKLHSY